MFGIDSQEFLLIAIVALVVIGPKDLPRVMRTIGNFVGRARGMARHFRAGFDTMIREAELEEMEQKWKADNEKIMREHPGSSLPPPPDSWAEPVEEPPPPAKPKAKPKAAAASRPKPPPARGKAPPRRAAPPAPKGDGG